MRHIPNFTLFEQVSRTPPFFATYRGQRDADGAPVLAKALIEDYPEPRELAKLRHEFTLGRELDLPCLARPLVLVERGHSLVLVWHDPGGLPLSRRLAAGPLSVEEALRIAARLARAVQSLHEHHVLHKDLSPDHIYLSADGEQVILTGLGIASRLSNENQAAGAPSSFEGTPAYQAPEQSGRMNRRVDQRSDLYSLGVIVYELLTGQLPFPAHDLMVLLHSHLVQRPTPPHELVPTIPRVVSDLVMRLLEKNGEDRYQYAAGLASDLDDCLALIKRGAPLDSVRLGRSDRGGELRLPQKLYGRDIELGVLSAAWERAASGSAELLLVRGYSGIGKSTLVHELHRALTGAHGFFISGKFDERNRSVPYAPLSAAFGELCHHLLMEPPDSLARFRTQIQAALGTSAQALVQIIPDLTLIIGPQPPAPSLEGSAARQRFLRLFQRLLAVFADLGRPLVLFLDDLQWIDQASLDLLAALLEEAESRRLLVIGAYRSNEVDAAHPLSLAVRSLSGKASLHTIELGPLERSDVGRFVADALLTEPERAVPLAMLLFEKTHGNPFFLIQLLTALHRDGILHFDTHAALYRWEMDAVQRVAATENVVEFLTGRIDRLPPRTQHMLSLASCIGHRFALKTLSTISESSLEEVGAALWPALSEEIVVPQSSDYRYLQSASFDGAAAAQIVYRFAHDRVQQAAYARISEVDRPALHLRIGRLLWPEGDGIEGEELFELISHLNAGADLLTDAAERRALASLDLRAAKQARGAAAYDAAFQILTAGVALLPADCFAEDHAFAFALHQELAQCAMLARAHSKSEQSIAALVQHARTPLERLEAADLRVVLHATLGRPQDAVQTGAQALREHGIPIPATDAELRTEYGRLLDQIFQQLLTGPPDALLATTSAPPPELRSTMRLLRHVALSAFGAAPTLANFLTALAADLSLRQGPCEESAAAYALLGAVIASTTSRFAEAHTLVKLAFALHERSGTVQEACMLGFYFATVSHYAVHWREILPVLERSYVAGLESGDLMFLSYTCSHRTMARFILGDPLADLRQDCQRMLVLMDRHKLASAAATQRLVGQTIACLELRTSSRQSLDDETFVEADFVQTVERAKMSFALYLYNTLKGTLLYLDGEPAAALVYLERAMAMAGIAFTPEACFITALAILALPSSMSAELESRWAALGERCLAKLATWAEACPANYLHKQLLVQAERARQQGQPAQAMELYDRALAAAHDQDWPRDLALTSELCARFYLGLGRQRIARAYMTDACYAYARWGAIAQVRRLAERYPALIPVEAQTPAYTAPASDGPLAAVDRVDMLAFIAGMQTLSREFVVENVVDRMMHIVSHDAGAERGYLILPSPGGEAQQEIYASFQSSSVQVHAQSRIALEESSELALTLVRYVTRTGETVVLDDASRDERFAGDPYIRRHKPRSIACLTLSRQGRPQGLLYLENSVTAGVFTKQRVELLRLLLSQATISIENAELYARVQRSTGALERSNAVLEGEVAQRTRELQEANERLRIELAERERSQAAQAELHAEVVRMQAERLAELSTPVIPIMTGIVLMPLHGSIDGERANQILEAALQGAAKEKARTVILDVTASNRHDAALATVLLRAARALRLLGTHAIVTGISANMARDLCTRGVGLAELSTAATLAAGMRMAMKESGGPAAGRGVQRP